MRKYYPKNIIIRLSVLLCLAVCSNLTLLQAQSDLFIDTSYTVEEMVMDFFNSEEVIITNVSYSGNDGTFAFFEGANTDLGLPAGIALCTGDALELANASDFFMSLNDLNTGDSDLEILSDPFAVTYASVLEFDIESTIDTLVFKYVFGSEEYPEYVCSAFNDVFGFFVSGPGLDGPFNNQAENIALIPQSTDHVSINSINSGVVGDFGQDINCEPPNGSLAYSQFYINNEYGQDVVLDAFTTPLPASFILAPEEKYHVKITVGDVSDASFDSGVFLSVESLNGDSLLTPPANMAIVINGNTVEIVNESKYATSYFWDFGDGHTSTERNPESHIYTQAGIYTISLVAKNYCCSDTISQEVNIGTVGLNNEQERAVIFISNPVHDYINVNLVRNEFADLVLYDLRGALLLTERVGLSSNRIDVSHLPNGHYVAKIVINQDAYIEQIIKL